jgi:type I restriction enzyme M protein
VPIEELFTKIGNGVNVAQVDDAGKYRVSRIQTIADGTVNLEKTKFTNDEVKPESFLQSGDILLSHINSIDHLGKTAIFPENVTDVIHGINLIRLVADKSCIDPRYAIRVFKTDRFTDTVKSFAQKAVNQASVKTSDLRAIQIPLPPLEVQQEIVAEIEGYQKIINGARAVLDNYRPHIPFNPEWSQAEIGSLVTINNGYVLTELPEVGAVACVKVGDMNLPENQREIVTSSHWLPETDKPLLPVGTVIFPKRGAAIATNKKRITRIPCLIDNNCMGLIVRPDAELVSDYLYNFLLGFDLSTISNSAGIALINNGDISTVQIPLPPLATQQAIVAEIEAEQALVNANRELITRFEKKIQATLARVWGEDAV